MERHPTVRSPAPIGRITDLWESEYAASRGVRMVATFARAPLQQGLTVQLWFKPRAIGETVPWDPDVARWLRGHRVPAASLHQEALRFSAFLLLYFGSRSRPSNVVPVPPGDIRAAIARFVADRRGQMPRSFARVTHSMPSVGRPAEGNGELARPILRAVTGMIGELYAEPAIAEKILDAAIADYLALA